ncbi:MAG: hypothetical protein HYW49_06480 [Deltaproteobacteria bacterium]|nr:hypothetical protein [Deltaproteobacteria bacterium]
MDRNEPAAAFLVRGYGIYHHRYIAFCIIDSPYGPDEIPDDLPADKVSYLTARFKGFELPSSGVLWFSNGVASVDPTLGSELLCSFKASQHDRPYTKNRQGRPYYDSEHRLLEVETGNSSVRWKLWTGSIMNVYDTHEGELTCRSRGADRQIVTVGEIRKALGPYLVCLRKTHYFCDGGGSSGLTGENK